MPRLALLLLPVLLIPTPSSAQASRPAATTDVTIYRCTNASGALTLRDSPCLKGEQQDVRTMQRPRDPAPSAQPPAPTPTPAAPVPNTTVQVVYLTPPRPLYECVTPDGETYTSDDGEGNAVAVGQSDKRCFAMCGGPDKLDNLLILAVVVIADAVTLVDNQQRKFAAKQIQIAGHRLHAAKHHLAVALFTL